VELPLRLSKTGPGAKPAITLCEKFLMKVKEVPEKCAMKQERNGKIQEYTWREYQ